MYDIMPSEIKIFFKECPQMQYVSQQNVISYIFTFLLQSSTLLITKFNILYITPFTVNRTVLKSYYVNRFLRCKRSDSM